MDVDIHNVKKVRIGKIIERKAEGTKTFYCRRIWVRGDGGRIDEVTMYADNYAALKMEEM